MRTAIGFTVLLTLALPGTLRAQSQSASQSTADEVRHAIVQGYIDGVFLEGDSTLIRRYWHPDCEIAQFRDGEMVKIPAVARFTAHFDENPGPLDATVTYSFVVVHVKGYAAAVILEVRSHGEYLYTDFMDLYKFDDGWKIVAKTYHRAPR